MPSAAPISMSALLLALSVCGFAAATTAKQASEDPAGFTVTGRIELPDKEDIPPGMHVSINTEWSVSDHLAEIAPDGTFEFKALAPGIYNLAVGVNGYAPAQDSPLELLVDHHRRGVIIHMARSP
jgi:hypothetical protein